MTWGNLAALTSDNPKRMLAYSSVAHAGYMLAAIAAVGSGLGDSSTTELVLIAIVFHLDNSCAIQTRCFPRSWIA